MIAMSEKPDYLTFKIRGKYVKVDPNIYHEIFNTQNQPPGKKYNGNIKSVRINNNGYLDIQRYTLSPRSISLARFVMNAQKGQIVDHINRDRLDNRRENLRFVTRRQNNLNRICKNETGFIGVSVRTKRGKECCTATFRSPTGKHLTFQLNDSPHNRIIAALARDKFVLMASEEDYAPLNFPHFRQEPFRSLLINENLRNLSEQNLKSIDKGAKINYNESQMNKNSEKISNPRWIADQLGRLIKGDCFADVFTRVAFSTDASIYQIVPQCVVAPKDIEDIAAVVKYAGENNIPVVARGAGSGLGGESLTSGIILDTTRFMNKIIGTNADGPSRRGVEAEAGSKITCQVGVVLDDLNKYLLPFNKKIGPDPSSGNRAVIGGVVANNSTGAHSLEYGYIAEYVEKIKAVLADGNIAEFRNNVAPDEKISKDCFELLNSNESLIEKAQPATKRNHSGYNISGVAHNGKIDMAKLLAGSEGTLCVFAEVTLWTVDIPKISAVVQFEFDSLDKMARAVVPIVDCGAVACELMGQDLIRIARDAFEQYHDILNPDSVASLLVEHTGNSVEEIKNKIEKTLLDVGNLCFDKKIVFDPAVQKRLFKCRKDAVPLLSRKKGLKQPIPFIEDVSVDNRKLAEYVAGLQKIGEKFKVEMVYYGHAGDGEIHVRPYLDLSDPADVKKMTDIAEEVFTLALSLGGSLSGEHADGLIHAAFMKMHFGREYCDILKRLKRIFDPKNILNPGKIISDNPDIMTQNLRGGNKIIGERTKTELNFKPDEFKFELVQCSGCGVCRSTESSLRMCPVFRAVGDEMSSSRARANLLAAWAKGILTEQDFESEKFREILSTCLNCKACVIDCPSGVDVSKMIMEVRAKLAQKRGLSRTAKILASNRYMSIFASAFAPISNIFMSIAPVKWIMQILTGIDKRRAMPKFGFSTFIKKANKYLAGQPKLENPIDKVAYFTDTFVNYNDHELGFAVIKFLRLNNIDVIIPKQRPAPLPAVVYGNIKTSRKDLEFNVKYLSEVVKQGYKIICSEPSAALCLKEDLRFFVDSPDGKIVSGNTFEFFDYLKSLANGGKLKKTTANVKEKFAHHTPCHLLALGNKPASIEVLKQLLGIEVEELDGGCCGIAGTFGMQKKNYDLSMQIGKKLAEKIELSGADIILTECSTCKMQIEHITGKKVEHPIKVLAEAFGLI
ncbi:MAG: anaerobic glycerol-3-phosphate dehydrogenase subunit C [Sedimentisphaerales bacterium]